MNGRYHIIIASLLLSLLLWVSLNLNQTYEVDRKVKIKFNVNKPYAVAGDIPLYLDTKIRGKGWSLLKYFTSLDIEFKYDVSDVSGDKIFLNTKDYLIQSLGNDPSITVLYSQPDTVIFKLERYEEKYVKLTPNVKVECKNGYQVVGAPKIEPDSILVGGAASIIQRLNSVSTSFSEFKNINSDISQIITLSDSLSNIINYSREEVKLSIKIEPSAEKNLSGIPVDIPNVPVNMDVLLIPQAIDIQIKGGVDQLAKLDMNNVKVSVNYFDLLADTTGAVLPKFVLPEGIIIISSKPEKIQYVIKKRSE